MERKLFVDLQDELTCPLCLCMFVDPRILPCAHTFCLNCLQQLARKNSTTFLFSQAINCPVCRKSYTLERGGVDNLPKNIPAANIIERLNTNSLSDSTVLNENQQNEYNIYSPPPPPSPAVEEILLDASAPPLEEYNVPPQFQSTSSFHSPQSPQNTTSSNREIKKYKSRKSVPFYTTPNPEAPIPERTHTIPNPERTHTMPNPESTHTMPNPERIHTIPNPDRTVSSPGSKRKKQTKILVSQPHFLNFKVPFPTARKNVEEWRRNLWWTPSGFPQSKLEMTVNEVMVPHYLLDVILNTEITAQVQSRFIGVDEKNSVIAWKQIKDKRRASYKDVFCLAVHSSLVPYYHLLNEQAKNWTPNLFQDPSPPSSFIGSVFDNFLKFVGSSKKEKEASPPPNIPTLKEHDVKEIFNTHCKERLMAEELNAARIFLMKQYPDAKIKNVNVNISLVEGTVCTLVCIPMYVCTYTYDGNVYYVTISGTTGEVQGDRPYGGIAKWVYAGVQYIWGKDQSK